MRYFKIIQSGIILAVGIGASGEQITKEEYLQIEKLIKNKPNVPAGKGCMLTENLLWEIYEIQTSKGM